MTGSSSAAFTLEMETRLGDMQTAFNLQPLSAQLAEHLVRAGKADALPIVLDVCELTR